MPQLPPVAAAIFVFCLLTAIVTTTAVVQIRSRRRRMRLAEMVRATAPIPRPAVSTLERPPDAPLTPLRRQSYRAAAEAGRFAPFQERPGRPPAAGRPARRLMAYAAPVAEVSTADAPSAGALPPVGSLAAIVEEPSLLDVDDLTPGTAAPGSPLSEAEVLPDVDVSQALHVEDVAAPVARPEAEAGGVVGGPAEPTPVDASTPAVASVPAPPDEVRADEAQQPSEVPDEPEAALPAGAAGLAPAPRITVLPPRPAVPALAALMTREVALGDAARVIRGALPGVLTMTDGRQLRRAVAVGAATSVVAAAFAIRGRRR